MMNNKPDVTELELDFTLMVTDNVGVGSFSFYVGDVEFKVWANSQRHPVDKPDRHLAKVLLTARLLEAAAAKARKCADGLLKHQDDIIREKERVRNDYRERVLYDYSSAFLDRDANVPRF